MEVILDQNKEYFETSENMMIVDGKWYSVVTKARGISGVPYSAYFGIIIFGENGSEIERKIKWLNDFSGSEVVYNLNFKAMKFMSHIKLIYRINVETPLKSAGHYVLEPINDIRFSESNDAKESYDLIPVRM